MCVPGTTGQTGVVSGKMCTSPDTPKPTSPSGKQELKPLGGGTLLNRIFFLDAWPVLQNAYALGGNLTSKDLPPLAPANNPQVLAACFDAAWSRQLKKRRPSIVLALAEFYGVGPLLAILVGPGAVVISVVAVPLLSQIVIKSVEGDATLGAALAAIAATFVATVIAGIAQQNCWRTSALRGCDAWLALTSLIYSKPARLARADLSRFSEGQMVNLISADCQAVIEITPFIFFFAQLPYQLVLSVLLLSWQLGWVFVIGLAMLSLNVVLSDRIGNIIRDEQIRKMKLADGRTTVINEAVQGVRTVKLYAWEEIVGRRIDAKRAPEVACLRKMAALRSLQQFLAVGMPVISTVPVFILYKNVHGELPANVIFTAAALFEFLGLSLTIIPNALNELRRLSVSLQRIGRFLAVKDSFERGRAAEGPGRVEIDGDFFWAAEPVAAPVAAAAKGTAGGDGGGRAGLSRSLTTFGGMRSPVRGMSFRERSRPPRASPPVSADGLQLTATPATQPVLRSLCFRADGGRLVLVCGRVGSGKTSLAHAVLGLLRKSTGSTLDVQGKLGYVPQNAFVMNDTVRENILFGLPLDPERYHAALEACELVSDIHSLPNGDSTEIGERGITISGGQRQRIAIARAVYSNPSLLVADDPLSAMDAHVGGRVFEQCLLGKLAGATRIFCTNQLQFSPSADVIYMLEGGEIIESGTFSELMKVDGKFASLYAHVSSSSSQPEEAAAEPAADAPPAAPTPASAPASSPASSPASTAPLTTEGRGVVEPRGPLRTAAPEDPEDLEDLEDPEGAPPELGPAQAQAQAQEQPVVVDGKPVVEPAAEAAEAAGLARRQSAPASQSAASNEGAAIIKLVKIEKRATGRIGIFFFAKLAMASRSKMLGRALFVAVLSVITLQYGVQVMLGRWTDAIKTDPPLGNGTVAMAVAMARDDDDDDNLRYTLLYSGTTAAFAVVVGARCLISALFFLRA